MIREPEGVDLVIAPHKFTEKDREMTIKAVAESKARLQKPIVSENKPSSFRKIAVF